MDELHKIIRVLQQAGPDGAALGAAGAGRDHRPERACSRCEVFKEMVDVTGLVVTKLDGSARGGIVVALAEKFGLPVHAVGVGEQAADLRPFDAGEFARGLVGG